MPTNAQLIDEIHAINPEIQTDGMTNAVLSNTLAQLKAANPDNKDEPAPKKEDEPKGPVIAKGRALTVPDRGVIGEGKPIKPEWLPGGEKQFNELADKGYIVK